MASLHRAAVELVAHAFVSAKIDPLAIMRPLGIRGFADIGWQFVWNAIRDIGKVYAQQSIAIFHLKGDSL